MAQSGAARLGSWWAGLSGNAKGALWLLPNAVSFAVAVTLIKLLGGSLPVLEIAFFSKLFQLLAISPVLVRVGPAALKARRPGLMSLMVVLTVGGMVTGFWSIVVLPLADATAISFTKSLFMIVLAVPFLGEIVGWRRWLATAVGFAGAVVMLRPDAGGVEWGALAALASAALAAGATIATRSLAQTEGSAVMILWMSVLGVLLLAGPMAWTWQTPTALELGILAVMGTLSAFAQWTQVSGYRLGEASALAPVEYLKLVFATLAGILVFAELPGVWTLVGAALIVGATLYTIRREAMARPRVLTGSRSSTPTSPVGP